MVALDAVEQSDTVNRVCSMCVFVVQQDALLAGKPSDQRVER